MGSNKKRNRSNRRKTGKKQKCIMIALAVVLIVLLIWAAIVYRESSKEKKAEETKEEQQITFPYELEDGKLQIDSLFQFTGTNPDCEDQECEEVGALQLTNVSEEYLASSDITIKFSDGSEMLFLVEDIPAGKSVVAFEIENVMYDDKTEVISITAKTKYSSNVSLKEESVLLNADDIGIAIENISQNALKDVSVKYHCNLNDIYFGGKSYECLVKSLAVGESVLLDTSECYLGEATVVSINY